MKNIAGLSASDRTAVFNETGVAMGLPSFHVEKDFWVCWVLGVLFDDPTVSPHLTFRGGTSLSKGWGLIRRFSEDIDLAMARGWAGDIQDPAESGIAGSQRNRRIQELRRACRKKITETLCSLLETASGALGEAARIEVEDLAGARDPFSIHFHYPSDGLSAPADYNQAAVKIELSGRADGWPREPRTISPYVAETFPDLAGGTQLRLSCVCPERTFWEKAALVHEQNVRPGTRALAPRQARHLYDLIRLWDYLAGHNGLDDLFDEVKAHRRVFYDYTWVDYVDLTPGALQLVPGDHCLADWRADYQAMRPMFFEDPPDFDDILLGLQRVQEAFGKP